LSKARETRVDWPTVNGLRLRCISWRGEGHRSGTVIICMGRTEFIEKYQDVVQHLLDRRFDLILFEWRGQGLSDRFLADRAKGHVGSFDDYLADLDVIAGLALERNFPEPRIMLAHSMGGQIGIRFLHDRPGFFAGAAMTAPMFGLRFGKLADSVAGPIVHAMCLAGRHEAYGFGQSPRPYVYRDFQGNVLTSSEDHFLAYRALIDADPDLGLGGATFGWIRAALRSMQVTRSRSFATGIRCPILLALAEREEVVDNRAIERMAGLLPDVELVRLPEARHEILIELEPVREAFWSAFDRWFSRLRP
jgi:lysophospholipase